MALNGAIVGLALLVAGAAEPASDAARESARSHYALGLELVKAGRYEQALSEFSAAYTAQPHPAALYNIAQTYIELDRPAEAVATLERYLAEGDQIPSERREHVRQQLVTERARTARLTVLLKTAGASVWVDGQLAGAGPRVGPLLLNVGPHDLALSPPGTAAMHQVIVLAAGQVFEFEWPAPAAVSPVAAAPELLAEPAGSVRPERVAEGKSATLAYWLGGVGLGLGAAALGHYFWNRARFDRWRSEQDRIDDLSGLERYQRQRENNELAASIESASHWTVALGVAGGALFASGATLLLVHESETSGGIAGAVLTLHGAF